MMKVSSRVTSKASIAVSIRNGQVIRRSSSTVLERASNSDSEMGARLHEPTVKTGKISTKCEEAKRTTTSADSARVTRKVSRKDSITSREDSIASRAESKRSL